VKVADPAIAKIPIFKQRRNNFPAVPVLLRSVVTSMQWASPRYWPKDKILPLCLCMGAVVKMNPQVEEIKKKILPILKKYDLEIV
jgi:hypothetical protein